MIFARHVYSLSFIFSNPSITLDKFLVVLSIKLLKYYIFLESESKSFPIYDNSYSHFTLLY